ncbi:hypothetical protein DL98DRAFT_270293 [Cadophora sp. DSE1049]|nr:hypothetical protein DL98DRAFT_270293 [Cadophora sp. DSE1049]
MLSRKAFKCRSREQKRKKTKIHRSSSLSSSAHSSLQLLGALNSRNSHSLPTIELNTTLSKSPTNLLGSSLIRISLAGNSILTVQVGDEAIGELAGDESDGVVGCNFALDCELRQTVQLDSYCVCAGFDCYLGFGDGDGLWRGDWCRQREGGEESEEGDGESGELHFDDLVGWVVCLS